MRAFLFAVLTAVVVFFSSTTAFAQRELLSPTGGRGQLNIDQLAGYRIGSYSGVHYAGVLGVAFQNYSYDVANGSVKDKYTLFWFAPALDYFVIEHLSIGGLLEIASIAGTSERPVAAPGTTSNVRQKFDIPSSVNFTILPRVGYMFAFGDRFGIWPRVGIGYASRQQPVGVGTNNAQAETFSSVLLDLEVPVLFRINETFYLSAAPQFLTSLGGSRSVVNGPRTDSFDSSFLQFAITGGFGVLLDL